MHMRCLTDSLHTLSVPLVVVRSTHVRSTHAPRPEPSAPAPPSTTIYTHTLEDGEARATPAPPLAARRNGDHAPGAAWFHVLAPPSRGFSATPMYSLPPSAASRYLRFVPVSIHSSSPVL